MTITSEPEIVIAPDAERGASQPVPHQRGPLDPKALRADFPFCRRACTVTR